jgi:ADP-dependent phosphofructokinase/glucokinase
MEFKFFTDKTNSVEFKFHLKTLKELKKRIHHVQKYLKGCFITGYSMYTTEKGKHNHTKFRDCVRDHLNSFKAMSD